MSADRFMILASDEQGGSVAIGPITGYTEALDARSSRGSWTLGASRSWPATVGGRSPRRSTWRP